MTETLLGSHIITSRNPVTGQKHDGIVYISTMDSSGDWTRIEFMLSVKDVSREVEELRRDGKFDKSTISDVVRSENGRIEVFSEVKERHPSGSGDTFEWTLTIDNTLARVVYYTSNASNIHASSIFDDIPLTHISTNETNTNVER